MKRMEVSFIAAYKDSIMKSTKHCWKEQGSRRRGMVI
jgi:hypothetical protein